MHNMGIGLLLFTGLLVQEQTQYKHGHMSWHHEQSNKIKRKRVNDDEDLFL